VPADKVFTLVPHVATGTMATAAVKAARPRGRPPKVQIPTFDLSETEAPSAEQPPGNVSQPASKQYILVLIRVYFHLFHYP